MSNVDINDLTAFEQQVVVSGSTDEKAAEEFFVPALPDDGEYVVGLVVQESKGVQLLRQQDKDRDHGKERTGKPYVMANLAFELELPNGRKAFVFDNPTSIPRGGGMSALEAVLTLVGDPIPSGITYSELKSHVEFVAAQTPRIGIVTQWEAQIKDKDGKYKTIRRGQKNFPFDEDSGTFSPEFEHDGQTVRAQAKVLRYKRA